MLNGLSLVCYIEGYKGKCTMETNSASDSRTEAQKGIERKYAED